MFVQSLHCFNAARGFVGGAATGTGTAGNPRSGVSMPHAALWVVQPENQQFVRMMFDSFNAARGFVGGAADSLAALVHLGRKSHFGKSPEI